MTVRETLRYRGSIGQWSWVMHRLTGLGVVLFLVLHVIDTSWAAFYPDLYVHAIAAYQTPLFTLGEFALVFAVVYHAFNGLRIALFDFRPQLWQYQARAAWVVVIATVVVLVPVFLGMFGHVLDHYNKDSVFILPLGEVIASQLPFIAGIVAAVVAAVVLAFAYDMVTGRNAQGNSRARSMGSPMERFWWSFMRVSGLLIIPLVFGHLAMMHLVQGVFDLTAVGAPVVGTVNMPLEPLVSGVNESGTAVEFVAERWNYAAGGVFIWRVYDMALLALVTLHGFNGLRYVLTDYTADNRTLRLASGFVSLIGAVILLGVGGAALLTTVDQTAIELAREATCKMNPDHAQYCADVLASLGG